MTNMKEIIKKIAVFSMSMILSVSVVAVLQEKYTIKSVPAYTTWSSWSDWTTNKKSASNDVQVQNKKQYRYSDKITTTSSDSSLNGWIKYNTTSAWGNWGNWSGWSGTAQSASDLKQVETRTEWRYYCFYCPVCGGREPLQGKSDCKKYTLTASNWRETWSPVAYKNSRSATYSYTSAKRYTTSLGDGQRWNFSSGNLNATVIGTKDAGGSATVIRRGYRYRTRSRYTTYYYYKWSDWSNWSDTAYSASSNRQVTTRTVYRTRYKIYHQASQKITASSKTLTYKAASVDLKAKTSGNGKLTYSSSNKNVAIVNAKGKVTSKNYGTTVISIKAAATRDYKSAVKNITVTVVPKKMNIKSISSPNKTYIKAVWQKDSSVTGYNVEISLHKNFASQTWQKWFDNNTLSIYTDGLKSNKTYYIRIRAYKTVDNKKLFGAWSSIKSVKIK